MMVIGDEPERPYERPPPSKVLPTRRDRARDVLRAPQFRARTAGSRSLEGLELDERKIDRSSARDLASDPAAAAIVRAIVALAHTLGPSSPKAVRTMRPGNC
jgi:hypothetical protein